MTEKTIVNLRDYLFQTLDRLSDAGLRGDALKEELERAKVIQATAGRIIETAKAQTDRMKVMDRIQSPDSFLEGEVTRRQITQGRGHE